MPPHARVQVLQGGGADAGQIGARASDPQAPVQIWTRLVEPMVAEETMGCGARMTSDSTSTRQPRLVPLMHQFPNPRPGCYEVQEIEHELPDWARIIGRLVQGEALRASSSTNASTCLTIASRTRAHQSPGRSLHLRSRALPPTTLPMSLSNETTSDASSTSDALNNCGSNFETSN